MNIGILVIEIFISQNRSLKDKRRIINSIKEKVRNKFNVSFSEVDHLNSKQLSTFGISTISNEKRYINMILDQVVNFIEENYPSLITDYTINID